jgi:hypothetical protein
VRLLTCPSPQNSVSIYADGLNHLVWTLTLSDIKNIHVQSRILKRKKRKRGWGGNRRKDVEEEV